MRIEPKYKILKWIGVYYTHEVKVSEPRLCKGGYSYNCKVLESKLCLWFDWLVLCRKARNTTQGK